MHRPCAHRKAYKPFCKLLLTSKMVNTTIPMCPMCGQAIPKEKLEEFESNFKAKEELLKKELEESAEKKYKLQIDENESLKERVLKQEKEKAETIEKLKLKHEEEIRKLENKTANELGEKGQTEVLEVLMRGFPYDKISETKRGKLGSDIFHKVVDNGEEIGLIVYEVKNVSTWSNKFIKQVKDEKVRHCANYAILVTNVFPAKEKVICEKEGVLIVSPNIVRVIANQIRHFLIEAHKAKLTGDEIEEKTKMLHGYLTSPEYRNAQDDLIDAIQELHNIRSKERATHERHWVAEENINSKMLERATKIDAKIASVMETKIQKIPLVMRCKPTRTRNKE